MSIFKQSIHIAELKYVEDEFEYFTRTESGKREEYKGAIHISTCENLLSDGDISLNISKWPVEKLSIIHLCKYFFYILH